jgi:hypothetical protein
VNKVRVTAYTTVRLSGIVQVSSLEPSQGAGGVGGKNASAHRSAAFVLGKKT